MTNYMNRFSAISNCRCLFPGVDCVLFVAGYDDDDSSPVRSAPKQRPMSMSQSMENLGARTGKRCPVFTLLPKTLYCIVIWQQPLLHYCIPFVSLFH